MILILPEKKHSRTSGGPCGLQPNGQYVWWWHSSGLQNKRPIMQTIKYAHIGLA